MVTENEGLDSNNEEGSEKELEYWKGLVAGTNARFKVGSRDRDPVQNTGINLTSITICHWVGERTRDRG